MCEGTREQAGVIVVVHKISHQQEAEGQTDSEGAGKKQKVPLAIISQ